MTIRMSEPVFVAATIAEINLAEDVLESAGVAYAVRPDHVLSRSDGVCLMGMLFEVSEGDASRCRALFVDRDLAHGVVTMDCS